MHYSLFALGLLSVAPTAAQAQNRFRLGPQAGFTLSSLTYHVADYPDYFTSSGGFGGGFTAGLAAQFDLGESWTVQPAVHYTRRAPRHNDDSYYQPNNYYYYQHYTFQLNYLTVPVNLLYSTHGHGQGVEVFAGPYLGVLLGGKYTSATSAGYGSNLVSGRSYAGNVQAGDTYATSTRDANYYSQQLDYGLQAGVGYGLHGLQLQGSFSYGLRAIGAAYAVGAQNPYAAPVIHNYGWQLTAAYLFKVKS